MIAVADQQEITRGLSHLLNGLDHGAEKRVRDISHHQPQGRGDCPIVRAFCTRCGKTHAILPDFIAPYRHIAAQHIAQATADIIEGKATAETAEGPQDASTTRRWVQRFEQDFNHISGMLQSILIQTVNLYLPLNKLPTIWQNFALSLSHFQERFILAILDKPIFGYLSLRRKFGFKGNPHTLHGDRLLCHVMV